MAAITEPDTHTASVMAGTQILKTELLINAASYYIHQDPGSILFVQPTQNAAEAFSKERFQPTVDITPELAALIPRPRARGSENTISHKSFPGGSCDFVGSNAPTDLASRPKRIALLDEIDKYPISAGDEGDPIALAEERLSTFKAVGRSKSIRTCSPTEEDTSRIGREYKASDQRRCFVPCPHCGFRQTISWANVTWSKDATGGHLPETAGIQCAGPDCGTVWTERERLAALAAIEHLSDHGWLQTKQFVCCDEQQTPSAWDEHGRALCAICKQRAPYDGHAGFHASKLLSARHRLPDVVREFLAAKEDPELFKKFVNTALAELWKPEGRESFKNEGLIARAETYGPDDLPDQIKVITGFADVQGDRLEVQLIGWGADEESWPFLYEVIPQDPAQPAAWKELDALLRREFKTTVGRVLRVGSFGIDTGGHHAAQVYAFARKMRGRRVFPTKGMAGKRSLWPTHASKAKSSDRVWVIGVDAGKDAVFGRLKISPPDEGQPRPGFIHFPAREGFGPSYFEQLTQSERRETRKKMGQTYTVWSPIGNKPNEALDTFVGALAVRRALPRKIERSLEYAVTPRAEAPPPPSQDSDEAAGKSQPTEPAVQEKPKSRARHGGWLDVGDGWL